MKFTPLLTAFLLLAVSPAAWAQKTPEVKEAPPKPPLLAGAPAESQWTITYTPKTPEKKAVTPADIRNRKLRQMYSPVVLSRRFLKGGGQMVIYTTYEADLKSEAWVVGKYIYELPFREGEGIHIDAKSPEDFPDIYWVFPANFRGTVDLKKRKVHLYETDAPDPRQTPAQSSPPQKAATEGDAGVAALRRAYIDPESRLPVMVEMGDTVMTYEFSEPPATFPVMDERINQQPKPASE